MNVFRSESGRWRGVALALLCGFVVVAAGCSGRRSEQAREEGDTLLKIGKVKEAGAAFARALKLNPHNARAKYGQGRILELSDKDKEALAMFKSAIAMDPSLKEPYYGAAALLTSAGRADQAEALARELGAKDPQAGGLLAARVYEDTNRGDKAIAGLTALRNRFPTSPDVRLALSEALLGAKQYDKAEDEVKTVVNGLAPSSEAAWMALIDVYLGKGTLSQELPNLKRQAASNPKNGAVQMALARALMETGALDKAERMANAKLAVNPASGWANYVLGGCFLKRNKPVDARLYLERASAALPRQRTVARLLDLAKRGGMVASAVATAPKTGASAASSTSSSAAAPAASAPADWQTLWREARLDRLLARRADFLASGGPNLAETLALAGLFTFRTGMLDELVKGLPESSPLRPYFKAFEAKKPQEMLSVVQAWKEPTDRARQILRDNAYGFAYAFMGRRSEALVQYSETMRQFPENGVALFNVATMYGAARMPDFEARALYKLVGQFPHNFDARNRLFNVYRASGHLNRAEEVAQATYALRPNDETSIENLANIYAELGDYVTAATAARRGTETLPGNARLQLTLATVLLAAGKVDECESTLSKVKAPPGLSVYADELSAFVAAAKNDWPRVIALCGKGAISAHSLSARLLYASALLRAKRPDEAAAALLSKDGKPARGLGLGSAVLVALGKVSEAETAGQGKRLATSPAALDAYSYGYACYDNRLYKQAYDVFKAADAALPDEPEIVTMALVTIAHMRSRPDRIALAKDFTEKHSKSAEAWAGLAEVCGVVGDHKQQGRALKKALELAPNDAQIWRQYAQYEGKQEDKTLALKAYQRLAELAPDDPVINNNLAYYMLETGGDAKEAAERASKALAKIPMNPNILHTLGLAQLRSGDLANARKYLSMALDLQPGDPTMLLDYGHMLIASGDATHGKADVKLAIQYADQLGLEFPRRAEAEKLVGAS